MTHDTVGHAMASLGKILIGAMSGTSADGVDAAAVSISGRGTEMTAQLLQLVHVDYPASLKQAIFRARATSTPQAPGPAVGFVLDWTEIASLTRQITEHYVAAVNQIDQTYRASAAAIAAHGQTFFHNPPDTLQLLDPALLAARTNLPVISDFRRADCAAGGQGAPLVPFADYVMFRHPQENRILLNIGGIANLTYLRAGDSIDDVIAFDIGPGNCVSDHLCRRSDPAGPGWDVDGKRAQRGASHFATAFSAARQPFVFAPPPKSTDTAAMIDLFENAKRFSGFNGSEDDEIATACSATAAIISMTLDLGTKTWMKASPNEILVSGGGVCNPFLMSELQRYTKHHEVKIAVLPNTMAQAKEAVAFALLGAATLDGEPSNVPSVTGASRRVILGSVTPKP